MLKKRLKGVKSAHTAHRLCPWPDCHYWPGRLCGEPPFSALKGRTDSLAPYDIAAISSRPFVWDRSLGWTLSLSGEQGEGRMLASGHLEVRLQPLGQPRPGQAPGWGCTGSVTFTKLEDQARGWGNCIGSGGRWKRMQC
jgi:hypothetical protein